MKYINKFLAFLGILIIIFFSSFLYVKNQKSINNQEYCLNYYKSINFGFKEAIIECNKY